MPHASLLKANGLTNCFSRAADFTLGRSIRGASGNQVERQYKAAKRRGLQARLARNPKQRNAPMYPVGAAIS